MDIIDYDEMVKIPEITTEELNKILKDPNWVIVDTRRSEAFSGWKMNDLAIEGHIKGATDFAAHWLTVKGEDVEETLLNLMHLKGITGGKNIVLYDANGNDAKVVARFFAENGCENIYYYDLKQWDGEVESYPHYERIVPVQWVKDVIDGKKPEHFKGRKYKIFEVSWKEAPEEFIKNHIPGSVHVDTDEFECLPAWTRRPDDELKQFAINNGIDVDTTVIIYGCKSGSSAEYKMANMLQYMGVNDVRPVSGGLDAWIEAGFETESGNPKKQPGTSFGGNVPADLTQIVSIGEAKNMLENPEINQLIDTRGWEEYIGHETGYDDCPNAGRIPGTIWAGGIKLSNVDGTMRNFEELERLWKKQGIDKHKRLAFFCGQAAWRGSKAKFYADLAGFTKATIFEGGWFEWQLDENNIYETGIPEAYTNSGRKRLSSFTEYYYRVLGYNCAETTLHAANDAWDLQLEPSTFTAMSGFGGGMGTGNVCGAISGGIAAMGYLYARETGHKSPLLMAKVKLFMNLVKERLGDEKCGVIGPENRTKEERCLPTVRAICDILDEVLDTEIDAPLTKSIKLPKW